MCTRLCSDLSPQQQVRVVLEGAYNHHLRERKEGGQIGGRRKEKERVEDEKIKRLCEEGTTEFGTRIQRHLLTGDGESDPKLRHLMSLCTAPVHPLPTKRTASFSEALTALRMTLLASSRNSEVCLEVWEVAVCVLP